MNKFIVSVFALSFFLFVGCGEEHANGDKKRYEEQIVYKGDTKVWDFDNEKQGEIPARFSNQVTGKGGPGKWKVIKDDTASGKSNVIAQTSQEYFGYHFNMVVNEDEFYDNLELTVKFKGVEGHEDQGGGPVWRYQDNNNYYIARANPLEDNFRVYKVVDGKRIKMDSARLEITGNEWHTIKILARKNKIQCFYNGQPYLEVKDDTFQKAGKIGLWTKADAVTYFDDLKVRPIE
jgi:hypothetical protein